MYRHVYITYTYMYRHVYIYIYIYIYICTQTQSKERFLANDVLFGSAYLVMAQIQLFLLKKNKDWTSRKLANPPHPTSDNTLFLA